MAVNFGPLDFVNNLTRGVMDDREYMSMLAQTNTALYLMYRNPITQQGGYAVANVVYKRKESELASSGQYEYGKKIDPPHITGREQFIMQVSDYSVDGFAFKLQTGRTIEEVVGGSAIPRSGARSFVNAYANEMQSAQGDFARDLNKYIIDGGVVPPENRGPFGNDRVYGLRQLATPGATWGGLSQGDLEFHKFKGFDGNPQPQWAPVSKLDVGALNIGADGDLATMMAILNHGGSQIRPSMAFDATYVGLCSQTMRNKIIGAWGDQVRRPLTQDSNLNTDITGARTPLQFEEFNLMIYPDTDMDDETIIVWNPACIRFAELDADRRYVQAWFMSTTNYTATLPFRKWYQMWCCDLSQIGMLTGITSVTRT